MECLTLRLPPIVAITEQSIHDLFTGRAYVDLNDRYCITFLLLLRPTVESFPRIFACSTCFTGLTLFSIDGRDAMCLQAHRLIRLAAGAKLPKLGSNSGGHAMRWPGAASERGPGLQGSVLPITRPREFPFQRRTARVRPRVARIGNRLPHRDRRRLAVHLPKQAGARGHRAQEASPGKVAVDRVPRIDRNRCRAAIPRRHENVTTLSLRGLLRSAC